MKKLALLILLACLSHFANAQSYAPLLTSHQQFFDASGNPLAGGQLFFYAAGTSTPQDTYTNCTDAVANTNPVVLDASGFGDICLSANTYKVVAKDASGVTQWTVDNVSSLALAVLTSGTQTITGAKVFYDIQTRGPVVDVRAYGAKCDGSTNDTAAFQQAAQAALYGQLLIPKGTCRIDPVGVAGVKVVGISRWGSILKAYSAGANNTYLLDGKLQVDGVTAQPDGTQSGFMASNLTLDGNSSGRSCLRGFYAQMMFENVYATGCYDGFYFDMPYMSSFHNLDSKSNTHDGFVFASSASECMTSLDIQNLWGHLNGNHGLTMGCFNYVTVANTAMQTSTSDDWYIDGTTPGGSVSQGLTLLSPASESAGARPFYIKKVRGLEVHAPLITSVGATQNWIDLDDATGTVSNWTPLANAGAGKYHVFSHNNTTALKNTVVLLGSYLTIDGTNSDFALINSGGYGTQANKMVGRVAEANATAQAANIAGTNAYSVTVSGLYRVSVYVVVTQAATTSSTMPSSAIAWTDADSSGPASVTATATNTGNTTSTFAQGPVIVNAKAGTNINYSTSGYASSGATPMQYAIHIRVEAL